MKLAVSFERWVLFQNGLLSAAPYLVMWIVALVSGVFVDFLVHKNFSISLVRKIFISIGKSLSTSVMQYRFCRGVRRPEALLLKQWIHDRWVIHFPLHFMRINLIGQRKNNSTRSYYQLIELIRIQLLIKIPRFQYRLESTPRYTYCEIRYVIRVRI